MPPAAPALLLPEPRLVPLSQQHLPLPPSSLQPTQSNTSNTSHTSHSAISKKRKDTENELYSTDSDDEDVEDSLAYSKYVRDRLSHVTASSEGDDKSEKNGGNQGDESSGRNLNSERSERNKEYEDMGMESDPRSAARNRSTSQSANQSTDTRNVYLNECACSKASFMPSSAPEASYSPALSNPYDTVQNRGPGTVRSDTESDGQRCSADRVLSVLVDRMDATSDLLTVSSDVGASAKLADLIHSLAEAARSVKRFKDCL